MAFKENLEEAMEAMGIKDAFSLCAAIRAIEPREGPKITPHPDTVVRWIRDGAIPRGRTLAVLARALNTTAESLCGVMAPAATKE